MQQSVSFYKETINNKEILNLKVIVNKNERRVHKFIKIST
jgi:hypothetical protein